MKHEQLKLENQLCFPLYAASRLVIRNYQPHLDKLNITYPQYLVLMILWEKDEIPVNDIGKKLILNTNTITPLLKRMEQQEIIIRERSKQDERKVIVRLTEKGKLMQDKAADIPKQLANQLLENDIELSELIKLKDDLNTIIKILANK